MRFRTVLFDLDGTLVDAFTTIHRCYAHTLPQFGLPAPSLEQVRRAVGGGLTQAMRHFVPEPWVTEAVKRHAAYAEQILLEDVVLMPGAAALLEHLASRGVACAVFTNKKGDSARRICAHLGLRPWLRGVFGAGDTPWLKPDPALAAHVLHALGADAAHTCLVGDSPFDIEAARQGGFVCLAVATGTHTAPELRAAARVYPDLPALGAAEFGFPRPEVPLAAT